MRLFELVSELHPDAFLPWGIGAQIHGYGTAGDPEPLGVILNLLYLICLISSYQLIPTENYGTISN